MSIDLPEATGKPTIQETVELFSVDDTTFKLTRFNDGVHIMSVKHGIRSELSVFLNDDQLYGLGEACIKAAESFGLNGKKA